MSVHKRACTVCSQHDGRNYPLKHCLGLPYTFFGYESRFSVENSRFPTLLFSFRGAAHRGNSTCGLFHAVWAGLCMGEQSSLGVSTPTRLTLCKLRLLVMQPCS
jgi:hypothetical protein